MLREYLGLHPYEFPLAKDWVIESSRAAKCFFILFLRFFLAVLFVTGKVEKTVDCVTCRREKCDKS